MITINKFRSYLFMLLWDRFEPPKIWWAFQIMKEKDFCHWNDKNSTGGTGDMVGPVLRF